MVGCLKYTMKVFLIISVIVISTYGRPEPPTGYQYESSSQTSQSLTNSYSSPLASVGAIPDTSSSNGSSSVSALDTNSASFSSGLSTNIEVSGSDVSSSESEEDYIGEFGENTVHKNIYVHLPSPQLEQNQQQQAVVRLPPPRVHYKIVFIKAPSASAASAVPVIPPLPQDEERTLVYVLVKSSEEQQEIVIPAAKPTEPSKPEVYFIRYKTQSDKVKTPESEEAKFSPDFGANSSSSNDLDENSNNNESPAGYGVPKAGGPY